MEDIFFTFQRKNEIMSVQGSLSRRATNGRIVAHFLIGENLDNPVRPYMGNGVFFLQAANYKQNQKIINLKKILRKI